MFDPYQQEHHDQMIQEEGIDEGISPLDGDENVQLPRERDDGQSSNESHLKTDRKMVKEMINSVYYPGGKPRKVHRHTSGGRRENRSNLTGIHFYK